MTYLDEDSITQRVIARHAGAADARLRDVMTSLVQHLHAFARDVKLTESEWQVGLRFLAEAGRASGGRRSGADELVSLSDELGLSSLVAALDQRKPEGGSGGAPERVTLAARLPEGAAGPVARLRQALGGGVATR